MEWTDLTPQKAQRSEEEMLRHLRQTRLKPRFSAGVWYFNPAPSRFHEAYGEKATIEETLRRVAQMYDSGLIDHTFRLEAHYPNEVNWDNLHLYKELEKETGIKLITAIPWLFYEKRYRFGSLSNPDHRVREHAIQRVAETLELNRELDTGFAVLWPGIDGYENPFAQDHYGMWERFESGLATAMDQVPGVRVALEPKPYEPRGNNIYRNTANGLLMAREVEARLTAPLNKEALEGGHALVGLNPEVGHVLMGHEDLGYSLASILREGRLMHTHWNSQPLGNYDQDLNVGVLGLNQTLSALLVLKMHNYQGYYGIDINPERMPVERALALNMNSLETCAAIVDRLDAEALVTAIYRPHQHPGLAEHLLTQALAPSGVKLRTPP